ncbi:MAG: chemotaxis protein CheW [Cyanobacteria bacterium P01_F01_bin.116]
MENRSHLIFELDDLRYGIETSHVREIFKLPELTPVADAPGDIIGLLDFRGTILPIMHLAKRLGQQMPSCQLSDSIIVIECQGLQVGMVVSWVHEVQSLPPSMIEAVPTYELREHIHTAFAAGIAKVNDRLITLLNPETLIRQTDAVAMMAWEARLDDLDSDDSITAYPDEQVFEAQPIPVLTNFFSLYCPDISPEEQQILRQRAAQLRHSLENTDISQLQSLVVIRLGEEYFGLELQQVREFINVRQVRSIPCCPPHIMGNINLRGEVMTLIDIRETLNMTRSVDHVPKAVVIEVDDIAAGITVDQVLDVVYLPPSDIVPMPAALTQTSQSFFQGATHYREKNLSILNLPKLFSEGGLVVDQAA